MIEREQKLSNYARFQKLWFTYTVSIISMVYHAIDLFRLLLFVVVAAVVASYKTQAIVEELRDRGMPSQTAHAVGWRAWNKAYGPRGSRVPRDMEENVEVSDSEVEELESLEKKKTGGDMGSLQVDQNGPRLQAVLVL